MKNRNKQEPMHKVYRAKNGKKQEGTPLAELYPIKQACQIAEILVEMETENYDN